MRFEDLQVIWDTQDQKPLYVLNSEAMERLVRQQARRANRELGTMEFGMMAICLLTAGVSLFQRLSQEDGGLGALRTWTSPVLFVLVTLFVARSRRLRRKREQAFAPTLLGDLDKAIAQTAHHLWMNRTFPWWFLFPAAIDVAVGWLTRETAPGPGEMLL
ncbi:MAG TPA: hypothetical protein P5218_16560, partial [Planctomycetota bacterium]|nr:hypothetical protein [Planctomycetota bacterium]